VFESAIRITNMPVAGIPAQSTDDEPRAWMRSEARATVNAAAMTTLLARDLRKLVELASTDDDGLVVLGRLFDGSTPLIRAEIDWLSATATGDFIVRYEVSEQVKAHLAAFRARAFDRYSRRVVDGNGHSPAPSGGGLTMTPLSRKYASLASRNSADLVSNMAERS
jgi:hypothetical protein